MSDFDQRMALQQGTPCCDSHNRHCEPPSELCCHDCTEVAHDMFPIRHADGSSCVNDSPDEYVPTAFKVCDHEGGHPNIRVRLNRERPAR